MSLKELHSGHHIQLGCDPELFIVRSAGKRTAIVGSEVVVPPPGLHLNPAAAVGPHVVRDGVQVELHAGGDTGCRQSLAAELAVCFRLLQAEIDRVNAETGKGYRISFDTLVKLSPSDMKALSAEAKELNCRPSLNAYGREPITRDGKAYHLRSGSGHLHFGTTLPQVIDPVTIVKMLDLFVGIPSVLIARDPAEAIRRETYGRAGEYRLPPHGLEYRVPSNFWLRDYKLESFIFGQAKLAWRVVEGSRGGHNKWAYDIAAKADFAMVEEAINTNNRDLALKVYHETIVGICRQIYTVWGLGSDNLADFEFFVDEIHAKGIETWFPGTDAQILGKWYPILDYGTGWERFASGEVRGRRIRAQTETLATAA